jgi:hypothetical protein
MSRACKKFDWLMSAFPSFLHCIRCQEGLAPARKLVWSGDRDNESGSLFSEPVYSARAVLSEHAALCKPPLRIM